MIKTNLSAKTSQHGLDFFNSELFKTVQLSHIFADSKTFADAIPKMPLIEIVQQYEANKQTNPEFNLEAFISRFFYLPELAEISSNKRGVNVKQHIEILWQLLQKPADEVDESSLLPLNYPYVVPGGRFREIYYWDSYFSALGLIATGHVALVEAMLANFIDLQSRYGCIPNGNRNYYLSRSQPPILALLVELLLPFQADKNSFLSAHIYAIETEYNFWMHGSELLSDTHMEQSRVVKMPDGSLLNRYWDDSATPRPESYREDIELSKGLTEKEKIRFYRNVRAACESGWDFSSRWLDQSNSLTSIRTSRIVPVDLNCLLYKQEMLLSTYYAMLGNNGNSLVYADRAKQRKAAILSHMWSEHEGFFLDYDLDTQTHSPVKSLAGVLPLFVGLSDQAQANNVAKIINEQFLKKGGLVSTTVESEQQWDAPNGWAPLHWFAVQGLINYQNRPLAENIMLRWLTTVETYFSLTGKMMEKYNVCQQSNTASGGEYKVQEGFGWTNGVSQVFYNELNQ